MNYWLFKSEPSVFGIDHLASLPKQTDRWEGVRNYQARNFMRDEMAVGDLGFFYHSSCEEPGIVGIVEVVSKGYPDRSAFDPESRYHDPSSDAAHPRWYLVDVRLVRALNRNIALKELKETPELVGMRLLQRGNRLSVMPVHPAHWEIILGIE